MLEADERDITGEGAVVQATPAPAWKEVLFHNFKVMKTGDSDFANRDAVKWYYHTYYQNGSHVLRKVDLKEGDNQSYCKVIWRHAWFKYRRKLKANQVPIPV